MHLCSVVFLFLFFFHLCSVVQCLRQNSAPKQEAQEQFMGKQSSNDGRASRLISDTNEYLQIPRGYIRSPSERPKFNEVAFSHSIPVIDLGDLHGPFRKFAIDKIRRACKEDGFFQIVNHGVQEKVIQSTLDVAKEFFTMPAEYRRPYYSDDPSRAVRLSTSFNVQKEQVYNWRDYLRHHCYPLENFVNDWPSEPRTYRKVVSKYCTEVRALVLNLLAAISESLGLESDFLNKALGKHAQHMAVNYYPRCPNPELTFGLPGHTDPNVLTVLLQGHVSGLQVYKNGQWCAVQPIPNAFVVNVGDQLQVLSNGIYKSVIHRAVVNSTEARISIPTFYCPSPDAVIEPASPLVTTDNPALYKKFTYGEYYQKFWSKGLEGKSCLNYFTADNNPTVTQSEN